MAEPSSVRPPASSGSQESKPVGLRSWGTYSLRVTCTRKRPTTSGACLLEGKPLKLQSSAPEVRVRVSSAPGFLESLYALCERGENRASARLALRTTDALLSGGHFDTMDAHFETLDAGRLGLDAIVALLILTRFAHDRMPARERFFEAAIAHLRENGGEAAVLEAKDFYR